MAAFLHVHLSLLCSTEGSTRATRAMDSDVELAEDRKLSWMAFPERGEGRSLHVHVLIAGIASRIYRYVRQWNAMAGHCHVLKFDPRHPGRHNEGQLEHSRGIDYFTKGLRSEEYKFDGKLHDEHLYSRFRRMQNEVK